MESVFCAWCYESTQPPTCSACGKPSKLQDRWDLLRSLGHGASGYTWLARDQDGSEVAIKELTFRRLADLKSLELFDREAETLATLDHPHIPTYRDRFTVEDGKHVSLYLVQEFIEGSTLDAATTDEGEVLEVLRDLTHILIYLLERRPPVVHRDIKPSNIMTRPDGNHVLIDFGSTRLDGTGGSTVAGTLGYMAPEQLTGTATPASDIYGLGATAASLLVGKDAHDFIDPFAPHKWESHAKRIDPNLKNLITRMLAADPSHRPTPEALLRDLDRIEHPTRLTHITPEPSKTVAPTKPAPMSDAELDEDRRADLRRLETLRAKKPDPRSKPKKLDTQWVNDIPIVTVGKGNLALTREPEPPRTWMTEFRKLAIANSRKPWGAWKWSLFFLVLNPVFFFEISSSSTAFIPVLASWAIFCLALWPASVFYGRAIDPERPKQIVEEEARQNPILAILLDEIRERAPYIQDDPVAMMRIETAVSAAAIELEEQSETFISVKYVGANSDGVVHLERTVSKEEVAAYYNKR